MDGRHTSTISPPRPDHPRRRRQPHRRAGETSVRHPSIVRESHPGAWLQFGRLHRYTWHRADLPIADLPPALAGLRILHLTDLHLQPDRWHPALDHFIDRVRADVPDLILLTGDLIDDKHDPRPAMPLAERLLSQLRARLGIYAILGNHDGDLVGPRLPGLGVQVIPHQRVEIAVPGTNGSPGRLELIGLPGVHRDDLGAHALDALGPRRPGVPRVVLSHYPDNLPIVDAPLQPDVFLAGHTHGGQICLPGGVPILTHDSLPRRLCRGVHRWSDRTWLVVSRGMGFTHYPLRLFCPAEVMDLRLTPATPQVA